MNKLLNADFTERLSFIADSPLVGITLTVGAFLLGQRIYEKCGRFPLLHPILIAVLSITVFLQLTGVSYDNYKDNMAIFSLLLGTATVALAVPLYQQLHLIRSHAKALLITLLVGFLLAPAIALAFAWFTGASATTLLSLAAKSVTTPIAMAVTESIGGIPPLAAGTVIFVGIVGALVGPALMDRMNIHNKAVRGFTLGLTSHAVGTARAFELDPVTGAFSSLGLALTGAITALIVPLLWHLFQTF
ncbi:LrgB family protein [Parendozoicomonas haliclonae]|uniref:Inner membrane protein YohK n=1 Tax=Parendozoicomonas haliclonae TaxID=1960125 RepID=A0A1X7AIR6_9GAMM|nr:LrgB family protein [Parendozoicomonas haliclonae]SMA45664.1 Inner membrane protein YohK [Parendozoicomonas haliclonae]